MQMTEKIKVEFVSIGYRNAIPKDKVTALKVTVRQLDQSSSVANVSFIQWKQYDPYANFKVASFNTSVIKNKFIFANLNTLMSNQTGYLHSPSAAVALSSNSFKY